MSEATAIAWVLGAVDPSSGTSSVHEVVRGLGQLLRNGWTPLRTILIASWDAEEYGLIGSTEWGEDFADWIDEHVVAYLNLGTLLMYFSQIPPLVLTRTPTIDSSVSGSRFRASATPSLAHLVRAAAEDIAHPTQPGKTLWDATKDNGVLTGEHIDAEALAVYEAAEVDSFSESTGVGVLGSGSDYTVFVQRNGVRIRCLRCNAECSLLPFDRLHLHKADSAARCRIPSTTTTLSLIRRDGKSSMAIPVSIVM